jgi:hemerythrin-like domain-containing protein
MEPRGPLMMEHRLIEQMIALMENQVKKIEKNNIVNPSFIDAAVDFIRTYADQTHHGKEEKILFRDLSRKSLSEIDNSIMNELVQEHIMGRITTAKLVDASDDYKKGNMSALSAITRNLRKFIDFYPKHIQKEDKLFFPAAMGYFTESERQSMLAEFWEFDRNMIHAHYKSMIESLGKLVRIALPLWIGGSAISSNFV